jgi:predicted RNase H-like HicB family nuclease
VESVYGIFKLERPEVNMTPTLTLEYTKDEAGWYVGRLREVPGVLSQGATLKKLEENVIDAYQLIMKSRPVLHKRAKVKQIALKLPRSTAPHKL